ncbi:DUF2237 family protein [Chitinimonas sp. BJYL2]|uniref:DUF2237 family protein n=1 Tax=Chitinimonas sp. BJYL2 TaxID=2976696 RepID=UPI0022B34733|nr:DUF2237 domain-containing protein [Chitinimonas sp. BJYL2]
MHDALNILGLPLEPCSFKPLTGFFRDGCCNTDASDAGRHTACVVLTEAFLTFSAAHGNDLSTPRPEFDFPGLKPGDRWCVCAVRWVEALRAGAAPKLVLASTHEDFLELVSLETLVDYAHEPLHPGE